MNERLAQWGPRLGPWLILLAWGGAYLGLSLLRLTPHGLDEGAARALLLNWSISHQVASAIVVLGVPDFRALLFIPLGIYWPGSILAAKVFTLLITYLAALLLFRWSKRRDGAETAMIATGLLLIAPLTLTQMDSMGVGPYLLLVFAVGAWVEQRYARAERALGSWFYVRLLIAAVAATLHPIGLALPAALAWRWYRNQEADKRQRRANLVGLSLAVLFVGLIQAGWVGLDWWHNPLVALGALFNASELVTEPDAWVGGFVLAVVILGLVLVARHRLADDLLSATLSLGLALGLVAADRAWAMVALAFLLYMGVPQLIRLNGALQVQSFIGQRGLVMVVLFIITLLFMQGDRGYAELVASQQLPPRGELIRETAFAVEELGKEARVASQWPGKTMIVCRCDALPLPPAAESAEALHAMLKGVTHLVFDPQEPANETLARQVAALSGASKTLMVNEGGVLVELAQLAKEDGAMPEPQAGPSGDSP